MACDKKACWIIGIFLAIISGGFLYYKSGGKNHITATRRMLLAANFSERQILELETEGFCRFSNNQTLDQDWNLDEYRLVQVNDPLDSHLIENNFNENDNTGTLEYIIESLCLSHL